MTSGRWPSSAATRSSSEYTDKISGAKAKRQGLDQLMADARRGHFEVVMVWASDRLARSVKHFLEVLDELNRLNIEYISFRENLDTGGPLGRAVVVIISAIAELERNLIIERVRAGMRRARLEGRQIGRRPLDDRSRRGHPGSSPRTQSQPAGQTPSHLPHQRGADAQEVRRVSPTTSAVQCSRATAPGWTRSPFGSSRRCD